MKTELLFLLLMSQWGRLSAPGKNLQPDPTFEDDDRSLPGGSTLPGLVSKVLGKNSKETNTLAYFTKVLTCKKGF
jgi:hypothetical protein